MQDGEHETAPTQLNGTPMGRTPNSSWAYVLFDVARRVSEETYRSWARKAVLQEGNSIVVRGSAVSNAGIVVHDHKIRHGQRSELLPRHTAGDVKA